jgi:hypothetical protein
MNQLYPVLTKTVLPAVKRIVLLATVSLYAFVANAQSLNFNAPTIVSGTDLQAGCVYRFSKITSTGLIDALVKVDSLIGVSLSGIDATPSGASTTAFQPLLSSLSGVGYHYAVFTITFVNTGSITSTPIFNFSSVFMGLDGSNQMTEFNTITVDNPNWQYVSSTPKVEVEQEGNRVWGTATDSKPTGGQGIDENDSTQMFRVSTASTNSVTLRVGFYQSQNGWNGNDLFSLNMQGGDFALTLLPEKLLNFTTQLANERVWLSWSGNQEQNVSHYTIERSYDNQQFEQVALLFPEEENSAVNSYSYKDPIKNTTAAVIYYRLKMVDREGKYKYSSIRSVRMGNVNDTVKVNAYPNPVLNELHISVPQQWQNKTISGQLLNSNGSIIKTFNIQQNATIGMGDVPAGTYYIKVANEKEISTQAIVKRNSR